MSSKAGAEARREEEIAFLAMEQVLGVAIRLADSGAGNRMPDGSWIYAGQERRGIVEITSPPATGLMREWARAKKEGRPQTEGGSIPLRLGGLAQVCAEMLAADWARENVSKLLAIPAEERHLFLFARGYGEGGHYFYGCPIRMTTGRPSTSTTSWSRTASRTSGSRAGPGGPRTS